MDTHPCGIYRFDRVEGAGKAVKFLSVVALFLLGLAFPHHHVGIFDSRAMCPVDAACQRPHYVGRPGRTRPCRPGALGDAFSDRRGVNP